MDIEIQQPHASTDPEALEIAKLAVRYHLSGYSIEKSIKNAFNLLNESRRFAIQLQEQRMKQLQNRG